MSLEEVASRFGLDAHGDLSTRTSPRRGDRPVDDGADWANEAQPGDVSPVFETQNVFTCSS